MLIRKLLSGTHGREYSRGHNTSKFLVLMGKVVGKPIALKKPTWQEREEMEQGRTE